MQNCVTLDLGRIDPLPVLSWKSLRDHIYNQTPRQDIARHRVISAGN